MLRRAVAVAATGGAVAAAAAYRQSLPPAGPSTPLHCEFFEPSGGDRRTAVVIGAGTVGVSLAYQLSELGFKVAVIDSGDAVSAECSAAAAGGMARSNSLVTRDKWMAVVGEWGSRLLGFGKDTTTIPYFIARFSHLVPDPHFWRWIALFSYHSLAAPTELADRQAAMLAFTEWAIERNVEVMQADSGALAGRCGFAATGAVCVGETPSSPLCNREPEVMVSHEELVRLEPATRHGSKGRGAVHLPEARVGDSLRFTRALAAQLKAKGVEFWLNTEVTGLDAVPHNNDSGVTQQVVRIRTNDGVIQLNPDTAVVCAAGSWTPQLLATLGLFVPIYPMKGYTIKIDLPEVSSGDRPPESELPGRFIVQDHLYASRLGDQLRFSSIGEFSGWDTSAHPEVEASMRAHVAEQYPGLASLLPTAETITGLRPFSADGILIAGRVDPYANLWVNVGPGMNGWKTAIGSAELVAKQIAGVPVEAAFDATALAPGTRIKPAAVWAGISRLAWGK